MLTKNEAWAVEMLSFFIGWILVFVSLLVDRVGGDFGTFVRIEATVMYLNYLFYAWRNRLRS